MSSPPSLISPSHLAPVSPSSASPKVRKLPGLKADLQKVAAARGNMYGEKIAVLVHWKDDDTGAKDDIVTIHKVLDYFGIEPTVHILQTEDSDPEWSLNTFINKLLFERHHPNRNTLFVFYYAGHARLIDEKLCFTSGKKVVQWSKTHEEFFADRGILKRVDSLAILDCCYAAAATRQQISRTTQVLAACGADSETKARNRRISFTMRLFRAVQHLKSRATTMTTAALFNEIQRTKPREAPRAVLTTLTGSHPITLAFQGATSSASPSRIPVLARRVEKHVLVKLTLHGDSRDFPKAFETAVRDLPPNMQVEVQDAYETDQSVFLILGMSWEAWALWSMVVDLDLIGVTLGPSLMHRGLMEVQNLPFRGQGKAE